MTTTIQIDGIEKAVPTALPNRLFRNAWKWNQDEIVLDPDKMGEAILPALLLERLTPTTTLSVEEKLLVYPELVNCGYLNTLLGKVPDAVNEEELALEGVGNFVVKGSLMESIRGMLSNQDAQQISSWGMVVPDSQGRNVTLTKKQATALKDAWYTRKNKWESGRNLFHAELQDRAKQIKQGNPPEISAGLTAIGETWKNPRKVLQEFIDNR